MNRTRNTLESRLNKNWNKKQGQPGRKNYRTRTRKEIKKQLLLELEQEMRYLKARTRRCITISKTIIRTNP